MGGWAKVYRKDRQRPVYAAVNIKECIKYTRTGKPTRFWEDMPATMVRKVALSRALREAFPNRFGGTLTTAEYEEIPEGQLPPAFEKNGEPDYSQFWARVKSELGITPEKARALLEVNSIKKDLIDRGWTLAQVWDELVTRLQQRQAQEPTHQEEDKGQVAPETSSSEPALIIDMVWLKESLEKLNWNTVGRWLREKYHVTGRRVSEMVARLTPEQQREFAAEVEKRLELSGY